MASLRAAYRGKHENTYEYFFSIEKSLHEKILTMARNPLASWVLETTITHTWRYLVLTREILVIKTTDKTAVMQKCMQDWEDIVDTFENRNARYASGLARFHLISYYRTFKKYLRKNTITESELVEIVHKEEQKRRKIETSLDDLPVRIC